MSLLARKSPDRAEKIFQTRHEKRNATDVFRAEVDFEQVLYRLALHAQSLFTAAACLGRHDELALPGGDSAADRKVALRHSHPPAIVSQVVFDGIVVDFGKVEVTRNGTSVALTACEFKTLQFFVENPDRVITRSELLNRGCGYEDGYTTNRSIDNHIVKLRHKLENDPSCPTHFRTVPRLGYRFTF